MTSDHFPQQAADAADDDRLEDTPWPDLNPRMRALFDKIGAALRGGGDAAWVDVQNELQDLFDEHRDLRRGAGQ